MIGKRLYLGKYKMEEYDEAVAWADKNNAMVALFDDYYEIIPMPVPSQEEINAMEVERLKSELASTDYKCLKYVDGALSDEEYSEVKVYRAELRQRINELQRTE